MILGLSSYTFGWAVGVPGHAPERPLDEHDLIERTLGHGLRLLQIADNLALHTFDKDRLNRLAGRAAEAGVTLEVGARRLTLERLAEYASIARRLRARLLRFVMDDLDYHPTPDAVIGLLRDGIGLLDGLRLGIENHDRFPAAVLRRVVETVGSEQIGICLDTANSLGAGEGLETVLGVLAPCTLNLHIKDFEIERLPHLMGFTVTGRPAGSGCLNLPWLLAQLAPFQRCQSAVLELWTPPEVQLEETIAKEAAWAARSVEFLKSLFH